MSTLEQTEPKTKTCFDCVSCYQWHTEPGFEQPEAKGWDCQHPGVSLTDQPLENPDPTYANSCSLYLTSKEFMDELLKSN